MGTPQQRLAATTRSPFEQIGAGLAEIFEGLGRAVREGILLSVSLSSLLVVGGFAAFYLSWRGAAATLAVGIQVAFLISGGLAGFAMIATGMGIMYVQMSRHLAAREDREWAVALDRALGLFDALRASGYVGRRVSRLKTISRVSAELK